MYISKKKIDKCKKGGILSLLTLILLIAKVVSPAGAVARGTAGIVKVVNAKQAAEQRPHNLEMEKRL